MIHLPEIKTAELSTYGNFAKCPLPRFACGQRLGTSLPDSLPKRGGVWESGTETSCKYHCYCNRTLNAALYLPRAGNHKLPRLDFCCLHAVQRLGRAWERGYTRNTLTHETTYTSSCNLKCNCQKSFYRV